VSEILRILEYYKETYFTCNIIPTLNNLFEISLFNTFRSFINTERYNVKLYKRSDQRGYLVENIKEYTGGQSFFSATLPGFTRGNHFHTRKIERFCVLRGEAVIRLRKVGTEKIIEIRVNGNEPSTVDIPVWYTHNITNTGEDELLTVFWSNEIFNPDDPDTFNEVV
jgi:UDP-2-acetamido-2,6-beta-L-arabino-hexul-4-ose reductase